jgi:methyltransferase (TIGR00027 family)
MSIDLGNSTNKGVALLKLAHQFQDEVLLRDEYVSWFFDETTIHSLKENPLDINSEPKEDIEKIQRLSYWFAILREKYGDEVIESGILSGCKQLLILGAGYETRFFRLPFLQDRSIKTFEVDLPNTIKNKIEVLSNKLGDIPPGLFLIPFDFNIDDLNNLSQYGFNKKIPTVYIWQGVTYYLPRESVSNVLDFVKSQMAPGSSFMFDACSPLMTFKNDQIPGITAQIDKLNEIGEPYMFGMNSDEMESWLKIKGFENIKIEKQDDLEVKYLHRRTSPDNMWYVVTTRV